MNHSYTVIGFRDSAKVLKDILEIIDRHEEVVTQLMGGSKPEGHKIEDGGLTALSTLNLVKEVRDNAPKHTKVFTVQGTSASDAVDAHHNGSGERH